MNAKILKSCAITIGMLIVIITAHGLVTGAGWLSNVILGYVPLGNAAVAVSLLTLAIVNLACLARGKISRFFAILLVLISSSWYPIGIIWSGNFKLSFGNNGDLWLPFSYTIAAVCLVVVVLNLLIRAIKALKSHLEK